MIGSVHGTGLGRKREHASPAQRVRLLPRTTTGGRSGLIHPTIIGPVAVGTPTRRHDVPRLDAETRHVVVGVQGIAIGKVPRVGP